MDFLSFLFNSSSLRENHAMLPALDAILGHKSAHSLETGPVMAEPFISPLLFTITPALSSKYRKVPSFLLSVFLCLMTTAGITFLRSSGFPFFTVAKTISPLAAAGSRFNRPRIPPTAIIYRFLAPVLSAQLITAPTGRPREMRNFAPAEPPRPLFDIMDNRKKKEMNYSAVKVHRSLLVVQRTVYN